MSFIVQTSQRNKQKINPHLFQGGISSPFTNPINGDFQLPSTGPSTLKAATIKSMQIQNPATNAKYRWRLKKTGTPTSMVLAVESPRSFWQWVEIITFSTPGVLAFISAMSFPNSLGIVIPTVSGMLSVVAPALITSPRIWYRNSLSDLESYKNRTIDIISNEW